MFEGGPKMAINPGGKHPGLDFADDATRHQYIQPHLNAALF
jgi:hypothetical protein